MSILPADGRAALAVLSDWTGTGHHARQTPWPGTGLSSRVEDARGSTRPLMALGSRPLIGQHPSAMGTRSP